MKAVIKKSVLPNDFSLSNQPIPNIDDNEILVKVKAIGVGIQDSYFFQGILIILTS